MNRASWALASLLVIAGYMPLHAQHLTEKEFLDSALANHPAIAASEAAESVAEGARRQAGIVQNPVASWEREQPDTAVREDTLKLDWKLPFDGRKHRVAAGDAALAAAKSDFESTQLGIRLEMRSLFTAWYLAAEREAVLEAHLDRTNRLARWLRARAEEGEAAGVEAERLDLEVEVFERQLVAARATASAERAAAAVWSDRVSGTVRPQRPHLPIPPATADVGSRPDLQAIAHRVAEAEAVQRLQRRSLEPPEISFGWKKIGEEGLSFNGPVYGIAWPLPVFDRNQGNREAATAEVSVARSQLELETRLAEQRARAALASYSDLYLMAKPADVRGDDFDIAVATFAAFEAGEASLTDVLDSLRATVEVQLARLDSLDQALAAERELEAAIGRPILPGGSS
ncbi:MAG: TolC family protein [Acidobacteriota bacterium]|nr:TolC family protein [Acidobacteriota bacterium]